MGYNPLASEALASKPGSGSGSQRRRLPHVAVGGVDVALASESDLIATMIEDCAAAQDGTLRAPVTVLDCNGQTLSMNATNRDFADALAQADLVHADGQFIVWMSRLQGGPPIPERTATTDLIHAAAAAAAESGLTFFLLGGPEQVNQACAERLETDYPGLRVAGRRNGYFDPADTAEVIAEIDASGADIVWVGLGKPAEQRFAIQSRSALRCGWIVTCGGCFHFVVGDYPRAPQWMQRLGLEWLHRMATGPKYLVGRYMTTIPHALWLVFWYALTGTSRRKRKVSET